MEMQKQIQIQKMLVVTCLLSPLDAFAIQECRTSTDNSLIVKSGNSCKINAGQHSFNNLIIEKNSRLVLTEGSKNWLMLDIQGDAKIQGSLIAKKLYRSVKRIRDIASDGTLLCYEFENIAKGGQGGRGSPAGSFGSYAQGGKGASGTDTYGGGGGSGAGFVIAGSRRDYYHGLNANNQWGAPAPTGGGGLGGNGGVASDFANGGLIYLRVKGKFFGKGGMFDLSGEQGMDGANSREVPDNRGGGGGGAPGSDGGVLIVNAGNIEWFSNVLLTGGQGGEPGTGYQSGTRGENGVSGKELWFDRSIQNPPRQFPCQ